MHRLFALLIASLVLSGTAAGCVTDRTGKSASYLMTLKLESTRARARALEEDLLLERQRIDDMQSRAAASRKRLAESGATLESFLEDLQMVRGQLALLRHELDQTGRRGEDADLRLTDLEVSLARMAEQLGVVPEPEPPATGEVAVPLEQTELAPASSASRTEPEAPSAPGPASGGSSEPSAETGGDASTPSAVEDEGDEGVRSAVHEIVVQSAGQSNPVSASGEAPPPSPERVLFQDALLLMKAGAWDRAGGRLQQFLRKYPGSQWVAEAMYLVAECLFELKRYKAAITEYQKVIERDERSAWAPRAMLRQALAFAELGTREDVEASRVFLAELVRLYPEAKEAEEARMRLESPDAPH